MSNLSQFFGGEGVKPAGLINGGGGSWAPRALSVGSGLADIADTTTRVLTGAVTAAALKTILNLSGRGCLSFAACQGLDVTVRTHRMRVTVDGVVIFDLTSASTSTIETLFIAVGGIVRNASILAVALEPLLFDQSLRIEYASSLTETDKSAISYRYIPR